MKCIDLIVQDHVVLRRALDIVERMLTKMENGERIEIADAATVLTFLRLFGHEYHQAMEETVLFPVLLPVVGHESPLGQLGREHGQERTLVLDIEDAVRCRRGMDFLRDSRRLIAQLKSHFEKENVILSELAEGCLSKEQDDEVVATFEKNRAQLEIYNLSRLERKYLPSPLRAFAQSQSASR